ncbi:MAG TPA: 16S rRNA (cytosine(967)-C(5))-methyltransferase RsmB [Firmicutes bacterium]|nr:16S rRNA (cytosine(967)-C(5))-methyltransferase RsmB [Bacillota bacterium]
MSDINEEHRDIGKIYELVYGILRGKNFIDFHLSSFIKKPVTDPKTKNILRIGYYQIKYMDSIPDYAAINTCVELTKEFIHPKVSGFVNAVLRNVIRNKAKEPCIPAKNKTDYLSIKYSYEPWMIKLFLKHYGEKTAESILSAGNKRPPVFIRVNTLKTTESGLIKQLETENITTKPVKFLKNCLVISGENIFRSQSFTNGLFYIQDAASQALGAMANPAPGETLMDIGAAPGGKTALLAQYSKNRSPIVAIDPDKERIRMIDSNIAKLGLENIQVLAHDASVDIPEFHNSADKIIIDAPCSALGVIRRHPEKKWCLTENEIKEFPKLQLKILNTARKWVKKNGCLFYSTCTINPAENEKVIEKFLAADKNYKLEDLSGKIPALKECANGKYFLSLPGNIYNMDGFFIAQITRKK